MSRVTKQRSGLPLSLISGSSIALALAVGAARSQTVATERGAVQSTAYTKGFAPALSRTLAAIDKDGSQETLLILVDFGQELAATNFRSSFPRLLESRLKATKGLRIGFQKLGMKKDGLIRPGTTASKFLPKLRSLLGKPRGEFLNCYAAIRDAARSFGKGGGRKRMLLITLDNADVEGDVEKTLRFLRKRSIRLDVISREAYLSDSYWIRRNYERPPRGTRLHAADSALVDLPFGWLLQVPVANEISPSGFGVYGLTRLAARTGGTLYVHSTPKSSEHDCSIHSSCLFCSSDHIQEGELYWPARVSWLAPSVEARARVKGSLVRDPWFRAVQKAWAAASRAGLISSRPATRISPTSGGSATPRMGRLLDLLSSSRFRTIAKRAEKALSSCTAIQNALEADIAAALAKTGPQPQHPRQMANAEYCRLMLQLLRVNLRGLAAWCREVAPQLLRPEGIEPPEVPLLDDSRRPSGIGFSTMSLCHGVRPYYGIDLPGGKPFRQELEKLERLYVAFESRFAHSAYGPALYRVGIARYHFVYPGRYVRPRRRPNSQSKDAPKTTTGGSRPRATRGGSGSSGGTRSGPTTGKE